MASSSPPICLLDDDLSVLRANTRLLESEGYTVQSFSNPTAFLDYSQKNKPPVAVIDMMMPLMNGLEVQSQLREFSPATRVIILTSNDDPEVEVIAVRAGVFAFFFKPAEPEDFLASVAAAVQNSGVVRQD